MKNYTSSVPVDRTLSKIESALVRCGATNIMKDYEKGVLTGVFFSIMIPGDRKITIRLPANGEGVYNVLSSKVRKPRKGTLEKIRIQADRTAWKLMQDWVEIQLSLIEMKQAELLQVFLPYVWDGNQTYYSALRGGGFRQLTAGQ